MALKDLTEICTIYVIKNSFNNKVYIGQTWYSLEKRFSQHKSSSGCVKLSRAIKKYGKDNFTIEILVQCDRQDTADYLEDFCIKTFDSIKNGYNLREGGSHGKWSDEIRKKISKAHLGKKVSDETRRKLSNFRKGTTLSNEIKFKITKSLIGNKRSLGYKHSEETRKKMSESHKGKKYSLGFKHSEETKKKHSILLLGNKRALGFKHTEETRKKVSEAVKGRKISEETKKKMSEARKKHWEEKRKIKEEE